MNNKLLNILSPVRKKHDAKPSNGATYSLPGPERFKSLNLKKLNFDLDFKSPDKENKDIPLSRPMSGLSETIDPSEISLRDSHFEGKNNI
jgi:hypothetical protein